MCSICKNITASIYYITDINYLSNLKQEIPSIIIPSDDKEEDKEDIFEELKSKEELNVIDSELPDFNILNNKENAEKENKEEIELENKVENKEEVNDFNTNLDFVINDNKKEDEKLEEDKEDNIDNNKEPYPTLPEQNFILVPESKEKRDIEKKQKSW